MPQSVPVTSADAGVALPALSLLAEMAGGNSQPNTQLGGVPLSMPILPVASSGVAGAAVGLAAPICLATLDPVPLSGPQLSGAVLSGSSGLASVTVPNGGVGIPGLNIGSAPYNMLMVPAGAGALVPEVLKKRCSSCSTWKSLENFEGELGGHCHNRVFSHRALPCSPRQGKPLARRASRNAVGRRPWSAPKGRTTKGITSRSWTSSRPNLITPSREISSSKAQQ